MLRQQVRLNKSTRRRRLMRCRPGCGQGRRIRRGAGMVIPIGTGPVGFEVLGEQDGGEHHRTNHGCHGNVVNGERHGQSPTDQGPRVRELAGGGGALKIIAATSPRSVAPTPVSSHGARIPAAAGPTALKGGSSRAAVAAGTHPVCASPGPLVCFPGLFTAFGLGFRWSRWWMIYGGCESGPGFSL